MPPLCRQPAPCYRAPHECRQRHSGAAAQAVTCTAPPQPTRWLVRTWPAGTRVSGWVDLVPLPCRRSGVALVLGCRRSSFGGEGDTGASTSLLDNQICSRGAPERGMSPLLARLTPSLPALLTPSLPTCLAPSTYCAGASGCGPRCCTTTSAKRGRAARSARCSCLPAMKLGCAAWLASLQVWVGGWVVSWALLFVFVGRRQQASCKADELGTASRRL